jgi:hypothetical protein
MFRKYFIYFLLLKLFVLAGASNLSAQHSQGVSVKTYPLRFVYGFNAELTYWAKNDNLVSVLYQNHQKDYFTLPGYSFDFNSLPSLEPADGFTGYLSYLFHLSHSGQVSFFMGPSLGLKQVEGKTTESNINGPTRDVLIDQQNAYYLGRFMLRVPIESFFLEAYFQFGAVNIQWEATYFNPDGTVHFVDDSYQNYWLPHVLGGIALGYHF